MSLHYRYGWPFGKVMASLGVPTKIKVNVIRDDEAGVFVGTSPDLRGLVVEADTLEELVAEARDLIPMMVCKPAKLGPATVTDVHLQERLVHA